MHFKLILLTLFILSTALASSPSKPAIKVQIPEECAQACPHHDGNSLCARNSVTGQLGMFDSNCILGRYNSCIRTSQTYVFVNYGECRAT